MNFHTKLSRIVTCTVYILVVAAASAKTVVAVNPLSASGDLAKERELISDVMQAELSVSDNITLVDRQQMLKALKELQLAQQGMVSQESAKQLGKIVGAQYFCSGKLQKTGDKTMAIVRIVDVETTLVKLSYANIKEGDDPIEAGRALAKGVEDLIAKFNAEKEKLAGSEKTSVREIPADWKRPVVMVVIPEQHVREIRVIDPAAETELTKRLLSGGFKVIDSEYVKMMKTGQAVASPKDSLRKRLSTLKTAAEYAKEKGADVLLYGEAIAELGATIGEFEGCRARVELKAVKVEGNEVLLADSAYAGATGLSETVAGKKAIQAAANKLADTFLYDLAKKWNRK